MTDNPTLNALTLQMLDWLAQRPRTYGETMEAWRTSCPRMPIWEDAVSDGLAEVCPNPDAGMAGAAVRLTARGRALLTQAA